MSSILDTVRDPLATALASVAASVYATPPEAIIAPACSIMPGTPYLEPNLINQSTTKVQVNLVISAIVAYNNNAGALDNLEKLMIQILGVIPSNYGKFPNRRSRCVYLLPTDIRGQNANYNNNRPRRELYDRFDAI